jgi:3-hydroxyacyl-[acyl-carrier-protein] dehydratase
MKVNKENISSVIPQRHPFIMIDNLVDATPTSFETDFTVRSENIFVKNNVLQEPALIENIAQTCAAGFGFIQKNSGEKTGTGFIGAISKLEVHALPAVDSLIHTKARVMHQLENVFLVKGENFIGEEMLVECELKIVIL